MRKDILNRKVEKPKVYSRREFFKSQGINMITPEELLKKYANTPPKTRRNNKK